MCQAALVCLSSHNKIPSGGFAALRLQKRLLLHVVRTQAFISPGSVWFPPPRFCKGLSGDWTKPTKLSRKGWRAWPFPSKLGTTDLRIHPETHRPLWGVWLTQAKWLQSKIRVFFLSCQPVKINFHPRNILKMQTCPDWTSQHNQSCSETGSPPPPPDVWCLWRNLPASPAL